MIIIKKKKKKTYMLVPHFQCEIHKGGPTVSCGLKLSYKLTQVLKGKIT